MICLGIIIIINGSIIIITCVIVKQHTSDSAA